MIKKIGLVVLGSIMLFACDSEESGPDITAPDSVTSFTSVREGTGDMLIELSWDKNSEKDLAGYILKRKQDIETEYAFLDSVDTEGYIDTVNSYQSSYSYEITAFDKVGNVSEPNRNAHSITSPDYLPPKDIVDLTVNATNRGLNTNIQLNWSSSDVDVEYYNITKESATAKEIIRVGADTLSYKDDSVVVGTSYSYTVQAVDYATKSSLANVKIGEVALAKPVFVAPAKDSILTSSMVTFTWKKVSLATSYEFVLNQSKDIVDTIIAPVVGENMSITLDLSKVTGLQTGIPATWNVLTFSKEGGEINSSADFGSNFIYQP